MANKFKGEFGITVGAKEYTFRFGINTLVALSERLGCDTIMALALRLSPQGLGFVDPALVKKGLEEATGAIEKYKKNTESMMAAWARSMGRVLAPAASTDVAAAKLETLSKLIEKVGGVSALSDGQVEKLGKQIEALSRQTSQAVPGLQAVSDKFKALREAASLDKAVAPLVSKLSGADAQRQMDLLGEAVKRMGGAGSIAQGQLEGLKAQVRGLAAKGAKVPAALKGMENGVGQVRLALDAFS